MPVSAVPARPPGRRWSRIVFLLPIIVLPALIAAAWLHEAAQGPGDPTTVLASGFLRPCRMAFDEHGDLFVAEIGSKAIYRVTPAGTVTLFQSGLADYRGIAFDAFGDILLSDAADDLVHRISPQGVVTTFADVTDPNSAVTIGPDGDVWVPAGESLHRFTPLGALRESIPIGSYGASGVGVYFSPSGEMYLANWGNVWKLQGDVVVPVKSGLALRNWGFAFDVSGTIVRAREAMEAGDTDRIILWNVDGTVVNDSLVTQVAAPCAAIFARGAAGATTNQLVIGQLDGEIRRANAAGMPWAGLPVPPLSIRAMAVDRHMYTLAGQADGLAANEIVFLDGLGNGNGFYDVGDFRAYLIVTGAIPSPVAGLEGSPALAALHSMRQPEDAP